VPSATHCGQAAAGLDVFLAARGGELATGGRLLVADGGARTRGLGLTLRG